MVDERDLASRTAALSLEQKVRLLTGADFWSLHAEPAAGLRRVVVSDGPAGVRGERWDERDASANVSSPTALAATWDEERVMAIGRLLAFEARRKGVDVLLAPTVNLHRTPYGGRHFECFSEDPLLTARIGVAFVRGVQGGGVGATVKHFVANDSETQRMTLDARVDERTLRELYLAPFEAIVREAGVWAVMAAYNRVNGEPMTESALLRDVLHREWGFDGLVMSDWFATRSTVASAAAALDLAMPGPGGPWGEALLAAVRAGDVDEAAIDDKVVRILRLAARVGALEGSCAVAAPGFDDAQVAAALRGAAAAGFVPAPAFDEARVAATHRGAAATGFVPAPAFDDAQVAATLRGAAAAGFVLAPAFDDAQVAATLRGAAAAGFVLARNEGGALPLDRAALERVAVIGPNAAAARTLGGGSATVFPPYTVSPLRGLRAALPQTVAVDHAAGVLATERIPLAGPPWVHAPDGGGPGVEVRFLAAGGAVLATEHRPGCAFTWMGSFGHGLAPGAVARVEVRTVLRATAAGTYAVACSGVGRYALCVGGERVFDDDLELPAGADIVEGIMVPPQAVHEVRLDRGEDVDVVLAHKVGSAHSDVGDIGVAFQLNVRPPRASDDEELERAVALASRADVAIVVVGTTEEVESEGFDRSSLALPGRQDELVSRVADANPRTVVVVNAGAPVLLPWAERVAAVLIVWFGGQELGNALADVLLAVAEPGGRLPTTWPSSEDGLPPTRPVDGVLRYDEGLFVGYRAAGRGGPAPRYPFGHGLGYTTWEYEAIAAPGDVAPGADVTVEVRVRNTGMRRGREVVQVYASRRDGDVERPARWLAGFAGVDAPAGADVTATVTVPARAFEHWDVADGRWRVEPGAFELAAGGSSAELPLSAQVTIARG